MEKGIRGQETLGEENNNIRLLEQGLKNRNHSLSPLEEVTRV